MVAGSGRSDGSMSTKAAHSAVHVHDEVQNSIREAGRDGALPCDSMFYPFITLTAVKQGKEGKEAAPVIQLHVDASACREFGRPSMSPAV